MLRDYLAAKGIGLGLDWDSLGETKIDPIFDAIEAADERVQAQIDSDFRDILEMSTEGARKVIIEEGRFRELDLGKILAPMDDHLDAAFWTFMNHPEAFQVASQLYHADNLPSRSWRKRFDLPCKEPAIDPASQERLGEAISEYYRRKEGRGHVCQVDHYRRGEHLYWYAYPQDYATSSMEYDDQRQFKRRTMRPAFEVVFVHKPGNQTLELFVRGTKGTVEDLQMIWGNVILNEDLGPLPQRGEVYKLGPLKSRDFQFPFSPDSGIEDVRVKKLRMYVLGAGGKITLEADPIENRYAVYDLLDRLLTGGRISLDLLSVTQVGFQMQFRDGRSGKSTLSFEVSYPNSCSLKHEPKHEIAREHLIKWGIDVSGHVIPDTEAD